MATVIQLKGADFSGRGLPNIYPYIQKEKLSYAYDFRYGNFLDLVTGEALKGWLSDPVAHTTVSKQLAEITTLSSNDLYVTIAKDAGLSSHKSVHDYEVGVGKFTAMIIGGLPENIAGFGPFAGFLEMGNASSLSGIPSIEASLSNPVSVGYRARAGSLSTGTVLMLNQLNFMVLVFDGLNFTWVNKTSGYTNSKSLTSLGITELIARNAQVDPGKHCFGTAENLANTHSASILLGQTAFWDNTALTLDEIDKQYMLMKQIYGSLI